MRQHIDRWLQPERASAIPTRVNAVEEISLRLRVPLSGKSWLNRELCEIACNASTCRCAMSTTPGTACNASVPCMAYNSRA